MRNAVGVTCSAAAACLSLRPSWPTSSSASRCRRVERGERALDLAALAGGVDALLEAGVFVVVERPPRLPRASEVLERSAGERPLDEDEYARLEERIDAARESREVERALASLDPRQREALLLVGHDGLSDKQAAAALHVTPTAFRMRLSRARRALKAALATANDPEAEMEEVA